MSTPSSAAATPTNTACTTAYISSYIQQTKDIACAVPNANQPSNFKDVVKGCCKSAPVESIQNDCGLWCLLVDQSVADLNKCFQEGGLNPASIYCNGNTTATATSKPSESSGASQSGSGSSTPSSTESGAAASKSPNAANVVGAPVQGVSKAGLGMAAMIAVSAIFGAFL